MIFKRGPIILVVLLILILFFIIGVRYGQRVEKSNKIINYLISLPPTQTPQPTQAPIEFKKYTNKSCGVEFLYLSQFGTLQESFDSASIGDINRSVAFLCNKNEDKNYNLISNLDDPKVATAEITFKDKDIVVKSLAAGVGNVYLFSARNPNNGKTVYFGVSESLYPLFEQSLEFIQ